MKILQIFSGMTRKVTEDQLSQILTLSSAACHNYVIPLLEITSDTFSTMHNNDYSPKTRQLINTFNTSTKYGVVDPEDILQLILNVLRKITREIPVLQDNIMENPGDDGDEARNTRTAAYAVVTFQYGFLTSFSMKIARYIVELELNNVGGQLPSGFKILDEQIKEDIVSFLKLIEFYNTHTGTIYSAVGNVPVIDLDNDYEAMKRELNSDKEINLLNKASLGFNGNPIYHMRLWIADKETNKYNDLKDTRRIVELQLEKLRNKNEGKDDAKLDKQISYYANKMKKISKAIAKIEKNS